MSFELSQILDGIDFYSSTLNKNYGYRGDSRRRPGRPRSDSSISHAKRKKSGKTGRGKMGGI